MADMTQQDYAESWLWTHFLLHTNPDRRVVLRNYLAELRRTATAPSFSQVLTVSDKDVEASLLQHLESLATSR